MLINYTHINFLYPYYERLIRGNEVLLYARKYRTLTTTQNRKIARVSLPSCVCRTPTQFRIYPTSHATRGPVIVWARERRPKDERTRRVVQLPPSARPHHLRHHARDRYPQASKTERETWTACPLPGKRSEREGETGSESERGREENAVRNGEWVVAAASGSPTG